MCAKRIHLPDPRAAVTNELIIDKITRGSRVIDLGCGDASLIARIRDQHDCDVFGVERDEELFVRGIEKGVPMLQADLNAGLMELPSQSFVYYVIN